MALRDQYPLISDEEYDRLADAGDRIGRALPPISPDCARRIAEILAPAVNQVIRREPERIAAGEPPPT